MLTFEVLETVYAGEDKVKPLMFECVFPDKVLYPESLAKAVEYKRAGAHVRALRPLVGSDFDSFVSSCQLGLLGLFSVDLPAHRAKRDRAAQRDAYIEEAYELMHLDRKQQHALIAAKLEATRFDGIWARSTGEYAAACRRLDDAMLAWNPAIALCVAEIDASAGAQSVMRSGV